jgi:hypothetical protein
MTGCTTIKENPNLSTETTQPMFTIYENDKHGIESIITNKALESFKTEYAKASKHKAFAQSLSGAWNWKSNRTSREHAITSALISCQRNNKKSEDLYPCVIINVDDEWVE